MLPTSRLTWTTIVLVRPTTCQPSSPQTAKMASRSSAKGLLCYIPTSTSSKAILMITDDQILEAMQESRGDAQLAFVKMERKLRDALNRKLEKLNDQEGYAAWNSYYIEYINHTLGIAVALGISALLYPMIRSPSFLRAVEIGRHGPAIASAPICVMRRMP